MTPGTSPQLNYGFDASGNLTTTPGQAAAVYDDAGELTSAAVSGGATTAYAYDADGQRLTAKQGTVTVNAGTWDGAGNLTSYSDPAGDMTAASYDGNGVRATATTGGTTQNFTWDAGAQLLMDSTNAYIYAGGSSAPAEQVNLATGQVSYLATDSLGSVRGVIGSNGSLTASTSYDAWGNPQTAGGLTSYTPFGYAGGYTDPTGLVYLLSRYYEPATGQFLSVDPDVTQTAQPYEYADGNPVSLSDPTGQWASALFTGVPYPNEKAFQTWLYGVLGGPTINTWEMKVNWLKGTPRYVRNYGNRRIDIFSWSHTTILGHTIAGNWASETKTGKTYLTTGKNGTKGEALRDRYLARFNAQTACTPVSGATTCGQSEAGNMAPVGGAIWWFSAKGIKGCQVWNTTTQKPPSL